MSMLQQIHVGRRHSPPRILIYGTEGIGKAQPLDAQILTPEGFVSMGEIQVGHKVIGSDGSAHRVLGVYPQGVKEVYRVTFRDGSTTRCCDDHLWFTQTVTERSQGICGAVRPLRDIRKTLRYGTHFNHGVPRVAAVQFRPTDEDLPIDPWLLGMYLGDGSCSGSVMITNPEADVQAKIADSLDTQDTCVATGPISLRVKRRQRTGSPSAMMAGLRELGLDKLAAQEKHVPPSYLHAGLLERLALLRGLLDSDGYVTNPGAVEFCTVSQRLASDVCFLIRSLGGSAKLVTKTPTYTHKGQRRQGLLAYRIFASFPEGLIPVSSEKHTAKWATPKWAIRHTIRSVEPVGLQLCQCIKIDAIDSLYVTDDFILTHNSSTASQAPKPIFIPTEDGLDQIDCASFPLANTLADVQNALQVLIHEEHDFESAVIDSLDWLERLIWDALCGQYGVSSIEKVDGGYARGYTHALTHWRSILNDLDTLRNQRHMCIILLAHAKVEKFEDPEQSAYDRYSPRLHKHATALITEWADAVLFATRKVITKTEDAGFGRDRTIASGLGKDGGERILRCVGSPACVAKNRYGLPAELPLSWQALMNAMAEKGDGR